MSRRIPGTGEPGGLPSMGSLSSMEEREKKKRFFKYTVIVLRTLKAMEKSKYNRKPDSIFDLFL